MEKELREIAKQHKAHLMKCTECEFGPCWIIREGMMKDVDAGADLYPFGVLDAPSGANFSIVR